LTVKGVFGIDNDTSGIPITNTNYSNGTSIVYNTYAKGETEFINNSNSNVGSGYGGFSFYNVNNDTSTNLLMSLDSSGNINCNGSIKSLGSGYFTNYLEVNQVSDQTLVSLGSYNSGGKLFGNISVYNDESTTIGQMYVNGLQDFVITNNDAPADVSNCSLALQSNGYLGINIPYNTGLTGTSPSFTSGSWAPLCIALKGFTGANNTSYLPGTIGYY